jgi:hypothetical protein
MGQTRSKERDRYVHMFKTRGKSEVFDCLRVHSKLM